MYYTVYYAFTYPFIYFKTEKGALYCCVLWKKNINKIVTYYIVILKICCLVITLFTTFFVYKKRRRTPYYFLVILTYVLGLLHKYIPKYICCNVWLASIEQQKVCNKHTRRSYIPSFIASIVSHYSLKPIRKALLLLRFY